MKVAAPSIAENEQSLFPVPPDPPPSVPAEPNSGWVTTLEKVDLPVVVRAMATIEVPLKSAGLLPPPTIIQRFSSYFPPGTPFSYILIRLNEISQLHSRFHICGLKDQVEIADVIHPIQNLTINDRLILSNSPAPVRHKPIQQFIKECARCVAEQRGGNILDIPGLNLEILNEVVGERSYLHELEVLHKAVILYLWLSFRFPGIFTTRPLATHIKEMIEENIEKTLKLLSFDQEKRQQARKKLRAAALLSELRQDVLIGGADDDTTSDTNILAENEQSTVRTDLRFENRTNESDPTEVAEISGDVSIGQRAKSWDNERGYAGEVDGNGSELQTELDSEQIFEDVSTDTTPWSTEEQVESVKDPELLDDQSDDTVSNDDNASSISDLTASSTDTSTLDESKNEPKDAGSSYAAWGDQVDTRTLLETAKAERQSTTQLDGLMRKSPAAEYPNVSEKTDKKAPVDERCATEAFTVVADSAMAKPNDLFKPQYKTTEGLTFDDATTKPSTTTAPHPLESIQPSSSDELAKLITAQRQQNKRS
jgi:hypothetical protein